MKSQTLGKKVSAPFGALPSGRSVVLKVSDGREEMEIRSPAGDVEVRITLTDQGAVVSLRGGQLQMQAADTISMNCRRLDVVTTEGTTLGSAGDVLITGREMRMKTEKDIHMNGGVIHLN